MEQVYHFDTGENGFISHNCFSPSFYFLFGLMTCGLPDFLWLAADLESQQMAVSVVRQAELGMSNCFGALLVKPSIMMLH